MGKKGGWLNAVKKAFSPSKEYGEKEAKPFKDPQQKNAVKEKKRWGVAKSPQPEVTLVLQQDDASARVPSLLKKSMPVTDEDKNGHTLAVAAAAEAAVAAAQAAAEVMRITGEAARGSPFFATSRSHKDDAVVKIQAALRGYLARRAFRALKGLMRLHTLVRGHAAQRQATETLLCMQSLVKVQAQVCERRIWKSEKQFSEGSLWQAQLHAAGSKRSLSDDSHEGGWDGSVHSADEATQAKLHFKHEATARRERALAYAYAHQNGAVQDFMLANGEQGDGDWSWLVDKWTASSAWEGHNLTEEDPFVESHDETQAGSGYLNTTNGMWKASFTSNVKSAKVVKQHASIPAKNRSTNPETFGVLRGDGGRRGTSSPKPRRSRPTVRSASAQDDDNAAASYDDGSFRYPSIPSYMASTKSAQAKSRSQSTPKQHSIAPEKDNFGFASKKPASYPLTMSMNGTSAGTLKSSNRFHGDRAPLRNPGVKGISGPMQLYHSYNEVSIGSIAALNGQMRRRFK